jgi:general secretion pathway protein D
MKRIFFAAALMLSGCAAPNSTSPAMVAMPAGAPRLLAVPASPPATAPAPDNGGQLDHGGMPAQASASYGAAPALNVSAPTETSGQGDISLEFSQTDIHTVVDQILGTILQQNYTIDSAVQGSVTLRTVAPVSRDALIPTLQTLLAQCNAVLVRANGIYRIMPADLAASSPDLAGDDALGGAAVVPLKYAEAAPLAAMLQPYVTSTGRIIAAADQNALIVEGDPASRQALVALIEAFDVDQLAGESYELFPVTTGDAQDFATAFTAALGKSSDPSEPGPVTVVPLERINAVLVIARTRSLLADAQRVYAVLNQVERETLRSWHVYYLHNGRANDAAYVLQQAFTPDDVTAQPTPPATGQVSTTFSGQSSPGDTGESTGSGITASATTSPAVTAPGTTSAAAGTTDQSGTSSASALLGPLSANGAGAGAEANGLRIITDDEHNSLLIYATADEDERINDMLDKIDIAPVEVRIDATIAEVDLNGALQYGTQFFFKSGGINAVLSEGTSAALATNFPGFVLSGHGGDAAPLAISLLQSVTKVDVLSSPELMVLDGQAASLQVGDLVPYLTQTAQSTLTTGSPVINSIDYRETGVILQVTPHVGSGGLVTLDVSQEVSAVQPSVTTAGISSPTFSDRAVSSRVAVQDGQTIGLAGLISDSDSHQNEGVPYLKNVPLLGDLFSDQNNQRTRTELLVLITPHVVRTQSDAADLTADLRDELPNADAVPAALATLPAASSADPDATLRAKLPQ